MGQKPFLVHLILNLKICNFFICQYLFKPCDNSTAMTTLAIVYKNLGLCF